MVACPCPGVAPSAELLLSPPCASTTVRTSAAPSASSLGGGGGGSPWSHHYLPALPFAREGTQSQSESGGWRLPSHSSHAWPPAPPRRHLLDRYGRSPSALVSSQTRRSYVGHHATPQPSGHASIPSKQPLGLAQRKLCHAGPSRHQLPLGVAAGRSQPSLRFAPLRLSQSPSLRVVSELASFRRDHSCRRCVTESSRSCRSSRGPYVFLPVLRSQARPSSDTAPDDHRMDHHLEVSVR